MPAACALSNARSCYKRGSDTVWDQRWRTCAWLPTICPVAHCRTPPLVPAQDGATPLHIASQNGHLDVVKELLSKGAAVDKAIQVHWAAAAPWLTVTRLHLALQSGIQGMLD